MSTTDGLPPGGFNLRPIPEPDLVAKVWSAEYDPATGEVIGGQWVHRPGIPTSFGAPGDITTTGGICLPSDIDYSVPPWLSTDRPFRDAVVNMHSHDLPDIDEMTPKQRRRAVAVCCHCGGLFVPRRKKAGWQQLRLRGEWRPELKDPERPPRGFTAPRGGIRFVTPPTVEP